MATSGTVTFRTNRNEIIAGALRLVSGIDVEDSGSPTATQITNGAQALNLMVKAWEAKGLQLWERRYGVIFPQEGQGVFVLGSPGPAGDHACLSTPLGSGYVQTTLSADAASGASSISVTSTTGLSTTGISATSITNAYNIGIQLDDGSVQWTTVNGAPSGTTVTLAATLTGAASSGNFVFCYQTKLIRPLRVLDAFTHTITGSGDYPTVDGTQTPVRIISRDEYNRFGNKSSQGVPTQLYHDPQSNTGYIYIYPTFQNAGQLLFIEFTKPMDDFTNSTDDYDMPQEWGEALKYNLALRLAPEYEVPEEKFKQIKELAKAFFDMIDDYDQEAASVEIQPNTWMYRGGY